MTRGLLGKMQLQRWFENSGIGTHARLYNDFSRAATSYNPIASGTCLLLERILRSLPSRRNFSFLTKPFPSLREKKRVTSISTFLAGGHTGSKKTIQGARHVATTRANFVTTLNNFQLSLTTR